MTTPFYNYAAARMYLERALEVNPHDWRVWANAATVSLLEDRVEEGRAQLLRAIDLRGGPVEVHDGATTPHPREALDKAGITQNEVSAP